MMNVDLTSHLTAKELREKIILLQNELLNSQIGEQKCQAELSYAKETTDRSYRAMRDPLTPPERLYPGGGLGMPAYDGFQQLGFIFGNSSNDRFPLYGRYKYPRRSDKYEYYIIDESRNRLKIPFKSKNDNELYDGDTIIIPEISVDPFTVKLYEYKGFRYYG